MGSEREEERGYDDRAVLYLTVIPVNFLVVILCDGFARCYN